MIADRPANRIRIPDSRRIAHRWLVAAVVVGTWLTGCGSVASLPSTTVDSSEPLPSVPATPPATTAPAPTSTDGLLVTGVGEESLIVVIHSVWAEGEDPSPELAALGDMQGFYFDLASNYEVLGAYVQLTPDFSTESVGNQVQPVPVELEHVELAALESEMSDGAECGREDLRPCPNPALVAFVANDFRFDGSTSGPPRQVVEA